MIPPVTGLNHGLEGQLNLVSWKKFGRHPPESSS